MHFKLPALMLPIIDYYNDNNNNWFSGSCTEFNVAGGIIQAHEKVACKACPSYYHSTEAYKCMCFYNTVKSFDWQ